MELKKRKYKRKDVSLMIDAYKAQYENLISELRSRISQLSSENKTLLEQIAKANEKEQLIISTLERAEKTADEVVKQIELEYSLEMERLKKFSKSWDNYFDQLKEKYPLYKTTKKAVAIKEKVDSHSKMKSSKKTIQELDKLISEEQKFDPKQKIKDYIVATSDTGFDMDKVLHPGKLELGDLCKELGLIEENE